MNDHIRGHKPQTIQIGYDANIAFHGEPSVVCVHFQIPTDAIVHQAKLYAPNLEIYRDKLLPQIRKYLSDTLGREVDLVSNCQPTKAANGLDFMFAVLPHAGSSSVSNLRDICSERGTEFNYHDVELPSSYTSVPPVSANPSIDELNAGLASVIANGILQSAARANKISTMGYFEHGNSASRQP